MSREKKYFFENEDINILYHDMIHVLQNDGIETEKEEKKIK